MVFYPLTNTSGYAMAILYAYSKAFEMALRIYTLHPSARFRILYIQYIYSPRRS